jgi:hypothetical protein
VVGAGVERRREEVDAREGEGEGRTREDGRKEKERNATSNFGASSLGRGELITNQIGVARCSTLLAAGKPKLSDVVGAITRELYSLCRPAGREEGRGLASPGGLG